MAVPLYIGMGPPYGVYIVIAAAPEFDPVAVAAGVSSVTMHVTKELLGAEVDWTAAITSSTAEKLTVRHDLDVDDLDVRGRYSVWVSFEMSNGTTIRTLVGKLPPVLARNQPPALP